MRHIEMKELKAPDYFVQAELDRLRVNVGFSGTEKKVIMFTSTEPNEGKSFVSLHLWKDLAKSGKRVCFVDADMRKSNLRTTLQLAPTEGEFVGLSHYLSGQAELKDVLYVTDDEKAALIPTVTMVNPSLLLEETRFDQMIATLRSEFDYVIVDTPPLGIVSDGQKIATKSDGSILIIRAHATKREAARGSLAQLEQAGCPILGIVLNRVDNEKSKRYYKKGYYSKSYYSRYYTHGYYYSNANNRDSEELRAADKVPVEKEKPERSKSRVSGKSSRTARKAGSSKNG